MAAVKTYTAEVVPDGRFWLIRIPELERSTQALRYKDVLGMARELIEIMDGATPDEYELHIEVRLPESVADRLTRAEKLREEARKKTAEAASESRAAVRELLARGLSQREAASLLKMSFQRVNQLANS